MIFTLRAQGLIFSKKACWKLHTCLLQKDAAFNLKANILMRREARIHGAFNMSQAVFKLFQGVPTSPLWKRHLHHCRVKEAGLCQGEPSFPRQHQLVVSKFCIWTSVGAYPSPFYKLTLLLLSRFYLFLFFSLLGIEPGGGLPLSYIPSYI